MVNVSCVMSAASAGESPYFRGTENTIRSYLSSKSRHAPTWPLWQARIRSRSDAAAARLRARVLIATPLLLTAPRRARTRAMRTSRFGVNLRCALRQACHKYFEHYNRHGRRSSTRMAPAPLNAGRAQRNASLHRSLLKQDSDRCAFSRCRTGGRLKLPETGAHVGTTRAHHGAVLDVLSDE
jgi:hypothetical protein